MTKPAILDALQRAETFMEGFEDDNQQVNIADDLSAIRNAISTFSVQAQDVAERKPLDLNVTQEWFEKRSALEGDHEIGTGRKLTVCIDPTSEELAELYRIAHRIPEGWQLVPIEPTQEMCEAAPSLPAIHAVDDLSLKKSGWSMSAIVNRKRYLAMIAAAPAKQDRPRRDLDQLEIHLQKLIGDNPTKARLAQSREDMRMWFVAQLTSEASGRITLLEIEGLVSRQLAAGKGGEA